MTKPAAPAPAAAPPDLPRPPPWYATLRAEPPALIGKLLGAAAVGLVFAVWWYVTRGPAVERIVGPAKMPSPGEVWHALGALPDGILADSIIASLWRVVKGFALATLIGVTLGTVAGSYRAIAAFFQPLVIFGRSIPVSVLVPVTFMFFGIGEKRMTMFIFFATVPFVFTDTVRTIALVPERFVETAQTLGATRFQIITKVLFPLALPDIVTSLRFLFGLAFGYIALTEAINSKVGLGALINNTERFGQATSYLMLFVIAILAFAIDWTLRFIQRFVFHYRKDL